MSEKTMAAPMPAPRPIQAECVTPATTADAKAATSILPSSPISTTPARSDQSPARHAARSGTDSLSAESRIVTAMSMASRLRELRPREGARHQTPEESVERAREQDDDASDHHHHV